jgi:tripeptidyl-peptidase-1
LSKKWIQFDATVAEAEALLYADFYVWEHTSGSVDISSEEYHIPAHVQDHIDYVTPGTRLREKKAKSTRGEGLQKRVVAQPLITQLPAFPNPNATNCDVYVTAECTRSTCSINLVT